MKILAKTKEYYDYLTGIYGVDEKIILDRKGEFNVFIPSDQFSFTVYICDMAYDGLYQDGKFYYLEELRPLGNTKLSYEEKWKIGKLGNRKNYVSIKRRSFNDYIYCSVIPYKVDYNTKENCPILFEGSIYTEKKPFPILSSIKFSQALKPEEIYLKLVEWLGKRVEKEIVDNRTNKEKIQTNGFDLKESFRNIK